MCAKGSCSGSYASPPPPRDASAPHPALLALDRGIRRVLILLVRGYQLALSPFLGGQCRFIPSCSCYAIDALNTKPSWKAVGLILWRIARCQPLCKGGFDAVKPEPRDEVWRIER